MIEYYTDEIDLIKQLIKISNLNVYYSKKQDDIISYDPYDENNKYRGRGHIYRYKYYTILELAILSESLDIVKSLTDVKEDLINMGNPLEFASTLRLESIKNYLINIGTKDKKYKKKKKKSLLKKLYNKYIYDTILYKLDH